jgi:hypothetical protein
MIMYLFFILIGIILYLLSNNKNGFSIGIPEFQFTLVNSVIDESNTIERDGILAVKDDPVYQDPDNPNIYYVYGDDIYDARRKIKRHMELNMDDANIINIYLTTQVINVDQNDDTNIVCEPNYRCNTGDLYNYQVDATEADCLSAFDDVYNIYNCRKYHTITNCIQNCSFVNENNVEKTLDNDGFQKIPRLVDVSYRVTDSMEMGEESMEPNFKTFYTTYENNKDVLEVRSDNGLIYSEYVFKMFLENINPDSNLHKVSDGIYFINGKIIISRSASPNLRISNIKTTYWDDLTPEQQHAATTLGWNRWSWGNKYDDDSLFVKIPNWENLTPEQQSEATILGWTSETWAKDVPYSKFYKRDVAHSRPFPLLHMDFQKYITYDSIDNTYGDGAIDWLDLSIDGKTSKYHYISNNYKYGILFNSNENSKSINLWLLLQGSDGVKTMGFIDIIDDDDSNKYNADTLRDMQGNDLAIQKDDSDEYSMVSFPGRLTPYFQVNNVQYPNVLNIQTSDNTLDPTKPDINPNILYTYDMIPGDVLAFRSDIPHMGFMDTRTSIEFRYDYVEITIPVSDYITFNTRNMCDAENRKKYKKFNNEIMLQVLLDLNIKQPLSGNIKNIIDDFFSIIFDELEKNIIIIQELQLKYRKMELDLEILFFRFLEFLDSKPTLNLDDRINEDYHGSLDRLNEYIKEFLKTL